MRGRTTTPGTTRTSTLTSQRPARSFSAWSLCTRSRRRRLSTCGRTGCSANVSCRRCPWRALDSRQASRSSTRLARLSCPPHAQTLLATSAAGHVSPPRLPSTTRSTITPTTPPAPLRLTTRLLALQSARPRASSRPVLPARPPPPSKRRKSQRLACASSRTSRRRARSSWKAATTVTPTRARTPRRRPMSTSSRRSSSRS
mmetsp:Transcript_23908/g.50131  ORF Transcript_23908/g.50131 Transcript_23908/m.50131 type:complete len:201 (+) Transcript_23908:637-1239(+)